MRITRSGLRRIIAEEHARILAEAKQYKGSREPHRDGDGDDVQDAIDILNDTGDDYYGSDDPFGDDAALAQDLVDDGAGGWRKKTDDEWAAEQEQGVMDYYGDPDPYGDDEALEKGYEYDGAGGWKKPGLKEGEGKKRHQTPRDRLAAYLDRVGADSAAIMRAVDRAVDRAHEEGSEVTSEDITFNLSNEVLAAIPGDDSDRWHSMLDAVLADEIDPDAFADAERDRQDVEDTERDLSHPSRFLEEGEDDDLGGADSATDSGDREGRRSEHFGDDPDWGPPGHDDWHIDNYDEEGDDIEGSDFDEMIDPADDNDDPMKSSWMNPDPYADTAPDDWAMADEPDWGRRSETGRTREKYRTTGDSDPGDAYTHMGPRGIDEARWAKLAGILKG